MCVFLFLFSFLFASLRRFCETILASDVESEPGLLRVFLSGGEDIKVTVYAKS